MTSVHEAFYHDPKEGGKDVLLRTWSSKKKALVGRMSSRHQTHEIFITIDKHAPGHPRMYVDVLEQPGPDSELAALSGRVRITLPSLVHLLLNTTAAERKQLEDRTCVAAENRDAAEVVVQALLHMPKEQTSHRTTGRITHTCTTGGSEENCPGCKSALRS